MSCDVSCDHSHIPLHYPKRKRKSKKIKRKINKKKRKENQNRILEFKHTITMISQVAVTSHMIICHDKIEGFRKE